MNKPRRKSLQSIIEQLNALRDELETLKDEEQEYVETRCARQCSPISCMLMRVACGNGLFCL